MNWIKNMGAIAGRLNVMNETMRILIEEFRSLAIQREDKLSLHLMSVLANETKYLCEECGMCEHFYTPVQDYLGVYCSKIDNMVTVASIPCEHFVERQTEEG